MKTGLQVDLQAQVVITDGEKIPFSAVRKQIETMRLSASQAFHLGTIIGESMAMASLSEDARENSNQSAQAPDLPGNRQKVVGISEGKPFLSKAGDIAGNSRCAG